MLEKITGACFTCPARTFFDGKYVCDPERLDIYNEKLDVARYKPLDCPRSASEIGVGMSPYDLLRSQLVNRR